MMRRPATRPRSHPIVRSAPALALTVLLILTWQPAAAQAPQTQAFTATGRAKLTGVNINVAQHRALQNALWLAVQQAVDAMVSPEAKAEHADAIRRVLARPQDFILSHTITQRGPSRGQFVVTVRAVVQMSTLAGRLHAGNVALLPDAARLAAVPPGQPAAGPAPAPAPAPVATRTPRPLVLMVVVPETLLGRPGSPDAAAETQIIKRLLATGYKVVDQSQVAQVRDTPPIQQIWSSPSPSPQLTQQLGTRYQADVLLVGQAVAESVGPVAPPPGGAPAGGATLVSARGRVQVRVIIAATGRVVASEAATASAADIGETMAAKEALVKAADLVTDEIMPRIAALQAPPAAAQPAAPAPPPPAAQPPAPPPVAPAPAVTPPAAPAPAATPAVAPAAERLRIAILRFELGFTSPAWAQRWDISLGVTEIVEEELFATGRYRVIERRALDQVLREQGIGLTGAVDAATAARVGRVLGVQALVGGTVNQFELKGAGGVALPFAVIAMYQAQVQLTARVINTTTGEILGIARGQGKAEGMMALAALQGIAFGGAEFDRTVLGRALDQAVKDLVGKLGGMLAR